MEDPWWEEKKELEEEDSRLPARVFGEESVNSAPKRCDLGLENAVEMRHTVIARLWLGPRARARVGARVGARG